MGPSARRSKATTGMPSALAFLMLFSIALASTAPTMSASTLLVIIVSICCAWMVASCLALT